MSGTWVLDKSRSNFGRFAKDAANAKITLRISHKEPTVRMTRSGSLNGESRSQSLTYYTDGRGETNPGLLSSSSAKSKTKWEGAKLVTHSYATVSMGNESIQVETIERRELSSDGKTLTVSVTATSPRGLENLKLVFSRSS
ncbi:MAG: hypothetical protein AB1757_08535 [Acidobacteriota bacterium]